MKTMLFTVLLCTCVRAQLPAQDARSLIDTMIAAVGSMEMLHGLHDVEYTYHYGPTPSLERYVFDGELSYGRTENEDGTREEFYNGNTATVTLDGEKVSDEKQLESAFFRRKTNFYWLLMMQKLGDPGVVTDTAGVREVEGIPYQMVDITFGDGVGVAKDRYLLYVNPYTHLVDQFLFTVAAVGRLDPILMKYQYGTFDNGVRLPVVSQSHAVMGWDGRLDPEKEWSARYRSDFSFNHGFTAENIGD